MKKLIFTLTLLSGVFLSGFAQESISYFRNNHIPTTKDSATYYLKFKNLDNGMVSYEKFCMDNILKEQGTVQNKLTLVKEGETTTYYTNGKIKDKTNFIGGLPNGLKIHYFENGKINYKMIVHSAGFGIKDQQETDHQYLYCANPDGEVILNDGKGYFKSYNNKLQVIQEGAVNHTFAEGTWKGYENSQLAYIETYKHGKLMKGENYALDGKTYQYAQRNKRPEPKGGIENFYSYVANSLQDINEKEAKVMMKFIVDTNGTLKNIEVIDSSNKYLNSLAISALKNAPRWNPALEQGKPVQSAYYMPILIKN